MRTAQTFQVRNVISILITQFFISITFSYFSRTTCCCTVSQGCSARIVASFSTTKNTCSGVVSHFADFNAESRSCPLRCRELHSQCFLCLAVHCHDFLVCLIFRLNFCIKPILQQKNQTGAALLPVYSGTFLKSFGRRFAAILCIRAVGLGNSKRDRFRFISRAPLTDSCCYL